MKESKTKSYARELYKYAAKNWPEPIKSAIRIADFDEPGNFNRKNCIKVAKILMQQKSKISPEKLMDKVAETGVLFPEIFLNLEQLLEMTEFMKHLKAGRGDIAEGIAQVL